MFSPENKRFTVLILAMVVIVLGTVMALVSMINHDHTKDTVLVTGFVGVMMTQLFSAIRAEQARRDATKNQEEIKSKVETAKQEIVQTAIAPALASPSPAQVTMPSTPMELREMIHTIITEFSIDQDICKKMVEDAARSAAGEAAASAAALLKDEIKQIVSECMRQGR